jgi:hypothetical protein
LNILTGRKRSFYTSAEEGMVISDSYFNNSVCFGVFHNWIVINKKLTVNILDASWKIPATYTIVNVPDLKIAEITGLRSKQRSFTIPQ